MAQIAARIPGEMNGSPRPLDSFQSTKIFVTTVTASTAIHIPKKTSGVAGDSIFKVGKMSATMPHPAMEARPPASATGAEMAR